MVTENQAPLRLIESIQRGKGHIEWIIREHADQPSARFLS
jgi:hypothetical protein